MDTGLKARVGETPVSSQEIMVQAARIESQFEEILDAAADESGFYDLIAIEGMDEPILDFACRLRCLFMEADGADSSVDCEDVGCNADGSSDQQQLLEVLDELCELAGTSVQLRTTWEDLARRFRTFRRSLIQYLEQAGAGCDRRLPATT